MVKVNGSGNKPAPPWAGRFSQPITRNRYVVGDIHGCRRTLQVMVEDGLCLGPEDVLYLLGDYIDRGSDSKGVLDYPELHRGQSSTFYYGRVILPAGSCLAPRPRQTINGASRFALRISYPCESFVSSWPAQ
jgi:hypothetical protein